MLVALFIQIVIIILKFKMLSNIIYSFFSKFIGSVVLGLRLGINLLVVVVGPAEYLVRQPMHTYP